MQYSQPRYAKPLDYWYYKIITYKYLHLKSSRSTWSVISGLAKKLPFHLTNIMSKLSSSLFSVAWCEDLEGRSNFKCCYSTLYYRRHRSNTLSEKCLQCLLLACLGDEPWRTCLKTVNKHSNHPGTIALWVYKEACTYHRLMKYTRWKWWAI